MSSSVLDRLANGGEGKRPTPTAAGEVDVILYSANADPNADKFLPWLWGRLRDEGLVSLYFPGEEQTGFAAFVKLFSSDTNILLVVRRDENGDIVPDNLIGFSTLVLTPFGTNIAAQAGFIFLKNAWDHVTSQQAAMRIMELWFANQQPRLSVVIGVIADSNIMARRFLKRIGWEHSGNIPALQHYAGVPADASIWYITRERFEQIKGGSHG